jgi:hypothetical protein
VGIGDQAVFQQHVMNLRRHPGGELAIVRRENLGREFGDVGSIGLQLSDKPSVGETYLFPHVLRRPRASACKR